MKPGSFLKKEDGSLEPNLNDEAMKKRAKEVKDAKGKNAASGKS